MANRKRPVVTFTCDKEVKDHVHLYDNKSEYIEGLIKSDMAKQCKKA